jgi:hypothetical protein
MRFFNKNETLEGWKILIIDFVVTVGFQISPETVRICHVLSAEGLGFVEVNVSFLIPSPGPPIIF